MNVICDDFADSEFSLSNWPPVTDSADFISQFMRPHRLWTLPPDAPLHDRLASYKLQKRVMERVKNGDVVHFHWRRGEPCEWYINNELQS